ncbi:Uncharacterised protein [Mycobacteroides abscessus subsp. abscessus]|nr:Uncharacterised protein [Mycobacteroides abscessus subsp. abscessus]
MRTKAPSRICPTGGAPANPAVAVRSTLRMPAAGKTCPAKHTTTPSASPEAATVNASRRLPGPSDSGWSPLRCAPVSTTGTGTAHVSASHKAVSSRVSVPCAMTIPVAPAATCPRTEAAICCQRCGVISALSIVIRSSTSTLPWPLAASRSPPELACRAMPSAPTSVAIVPPVVNRTSAGEESFGRRAAGTAAIIADRLRKALRRVRDDGGRE